MAATEIALTFPIAGAQAIGILHQPAVPSAVGVVVIVGGPQYRVGSHRQFVLLARALAAAGTAVLRFDYRGIGDSAGPSQNFETVGQDIRAAVDELAARARVERVVLWGLCDAASAALMYAHGDPRIAGLVLLNPWVHAPQTEGRARLKTYYTARLRSPAFWRKLAALDIDWRDSLRSLCRYGVNALGWNRAREEAPQEQFIERMQRGWQAFDGPVLLLMSGDDLTAAEFRQLTATSRAWRQLLADKPVRQFTFAEATHTFARAEWRAAVERETLAWLATLSAGNEKKH